MFFMLECISFNNILAHMGIFHGVRNIFIQYSFAGLSTVSDLT